jgi:signal transduction histidine kinase
VGDRPVTVISGRLAARRATRADHDGVADIRRLKIIGIVLPVAFILASGFIEQVVIERLHPDPGQLTLELVVVGCVFLFGFVMFFLIERAHRVILRQNQAMVAANAVFAAIRGDLDVDQIIDAVLDNVLASTGAAGVAVTAPVVPDWQPGEDDGDGAAGDVVTWSKVADAESAAGLGADGGQDPAAPTQVLDIPLLAGSTAVGAMLLHLGTGIGKADWPTADMLTGISQQLGSTIQYARLIADMQRRKHEGRALYDVLLQISNQISPEVTLSSVVSIARDQLHADDAVLCLTEAICGFMPTDGTSVPMAPARDEAVCVAPDSVKPRTHQQHACPKRTCPQFQASVCVSLPGPNGPCGELWLGRREDRPFSRQDRHFLEVLAELAVIAITNARILENERQEAILAERERIAREMHDSLAQVLGVTHIRLRALLSRPTVRGIPPVESEISDLADLCHEAYGDVREAILGLREASRPDRPLLDGLRAYMEKFSRQSGVQTTLESTLDHELVLSPRCEVQVIRVIQEALTNVRKHSGARSAVVRVTATADSTTFTVQDDGRGFELNTVPADRDGFGLQSMRERIRLVNGRIRIESAPRSGTRIILDVPGGRRTTLLPPKAVER